MSQAFGLARRIAWDFVGLALSCTWVQCGRDAAEDPVGSLVVHVVEKQLHLDVAANVGAYPTNTDPRSLPLVVRYCVDCLRCTPSATPAGFPASPGSRSNSDSAWHPARQYSILSRACPDSPPTWLSCRKWSPCSTSSSLVGNDGFTSAGDAREEHCRRGPARVGRGGRCQAHGALVAGRVGTQPEQSRAMS